MLNDLEVRIDAERKPDGSRQFPGKTCRDIQMCFPESKTGYYFIDPNGGGKNDAIMAYCDFDRTDIVETCVFPQETTYKLDNWVPHGEDKYRWFMGDIQTTYDDKIRYEQRRSNSQIKSLRIGNTQARQNVTYVCKNSHANKDASGEKKSFVKLLSNSGEEIHVNGGRRTRLDVVKDECHLKDGQTRQAVFEYSSSRTVNLPIIDVAVFDVADDGEAFGLEIGPVCFS